MSDGDNSIENPLFSVLYRFHAAGEILHCIRALPSTRVRKYQYCDIMFCYTVSILKTTVSIFLCVCVSGTVIYKNADPTFLIL